MTEVIRNDWIPRYKDAGYDLLVNNITSQYIKLSLSNLTFLLNHNGSLFDLDDDLTGKMIADFYAFGFCPNVLIDGQPPTGALARPAAVTGIAENANGVYFSAPVTGTYTVYWYVNGDLKVIQEDVDISVNRSCSKSSLGTNIGDVVQIALESNNIVGWWARYTVTS